MSEIAREIEAEIKQEKFQSLWRSFGSYLVAASLAIVLATAVAVVWQNHLQTANEAASLKIYQGNRQMEASKPAEAVSHYASVDQGGASLRMIAKIQQAKALIAEGKQDDAIKLLNDVRASKSGDPALRAIATLIALSESKTHDKAWYDALEAAAKPDVPFAATAREMLALARMDDGDPKAAAESMRILKDDPTAPGTLRDRATRLYHSLSSMPSS